MHLFKKYDGQGVRIIIEAWIFDDIENLESSKLLVSVKCDITKLSKIVCNGYNLMEPEHSQRFTMQKLEILMPQVFSVESVVADKSLDI